MRELAATLAGSNALLLPLPRSPWQRCVLGSAGARWDSCRLYPQGSEMTDQFLEQVEDVKTVAGF